MYTREEKILMIINEFTEILNFNEVNIHKFYEYLDNKSKNEEYLIDVLFMALS